MWYKCIHITLCISVMLGTGYNIQIGQDLKSKFLVNLGIIYRYNRLIFWSHFLRDRSSPILTCTFMKSRNVVVLPDAKVLDNHCTNIAFLIFLLQRVAIMAYLESIRYNLVQTFQIEHYRTAIKPGANLLSLKCGFIRSTKFIKKSFRLLLISAINL